ncbi:phytanoyl-CoA dioxygenase family protein [Tenggerimyces flavus]|uniref:Phytanoyl-CoA dioxygenase family protein n=1 Tax=Tenggerimyces flavus TaxID=1708749 RepID=A0ABV7YJH2_9ACTN|nr:phytanoyl-CoA dioxygenase family protein [Tenggerimyces flavus]MBM7789661.1 hypothetical protein [Tenggerimyces flavus]
MTASRIHHEVPVENVDRDGFFLVEELISAADCARFADRLQEYAAGSRPLPAGVELQREPLARQQADGLDIRKISGLWGDDLFRSLISSEEITGRVRALVGGDLRLYRADALMKPPSVGSEKGVHQDSPYWPIEPMSLWSCWIPFDDATIDNGCMMVVPGSHRAGALPHENTAHDYVVPQTHYDVDKLVHVPMARGTGLFFHSLLVHATAANQSGSPRRAVTMSYFGPDHHHIGDAPRTPYPSVIA